MSEQNEITRILCAMPTDPPTETARTSARLFSLVYEELHKLAEARLKREKPPVKVKLVELRFFAGLSMEQTNAVLGMSRGTANRHWIFARAWLFMRISGESFGGNGNGFDDNPR